jgi:small subunit ribosomal protein S2
MSETTVDPSAQADATPEAADSESAPVLAPLSIRTLLEAGIHFGHQMRRWNPKMRSYIFGDRNGIHIIDLDQTLPLFEEAIDFVRDTVAEGGKVLIVGTKRQAATSVMLAAQRCGQYYVNNRWLGGMLTNWKTVKKSIDRYKNVLETLADEERVAALSKKELARLNRMRVKYEKSLAGIRDMNRLPDVMFVIDVGKEQIAVSEARRLGITIVGVVDSNNDPEQIDFVIPGNDDAIRAIDLYCGHVAQACSEGYAIHQERLRAERPEKAVESGPAASGRRVVEISQAPRRGRGVNTASAGGWAPRDASPSTAATPAAATPTPAAAAPTPEAAAPAVEAAAPAAEAAAPAAEEAAPAAAEPSAEKAAGDETKAPSEDSQG